MMRVSFDASDGRAKVPLGIVGLIRAQSIR